MDNEHAEGWFLESVGTYLRADGWTFPMTENGGYHDDEFVSHHVSEISDEGAEWWDSLSARDVMTIQNYLDVRHDIEKIRRLKRLAKVEEM